MKQYTTNEQTAKLIELGFEKPKSMAEYDLPAGDWRIGAKGLRPAYSIGELIAMLPKEIEKHSWDFYSINIYFDTFNWNVCYKNRKEQIAYQTSAIEELVNALFEMVVKLKEEGI